jgi:hypothetical protein
VILTVDQIYAFMAEAGFPLQVATSLTAIALRESGGNPAAFNGNSATGDRSYGLLQINMKDPNVARLIYERILGIPLDSGEPVPFDQAAEQKLLDPQTNADAGYLLWGHANSNLNLAWYIDKSGPPYHYQERYENHLADAQAAALRYIPQSPHA